MCGIVGMIHWHRSMESSLKERLSAMCQAIFHRGSDDSGIFTDNNEVGLGIRLLSIKEVVPGQKDFTEPIFALLTFELWRQQFQVSVG